MPMEIFNSVPELESQNNCRMVVDTNKTDVLVMDSSFLMDRLLRVVAVCKT